MTDLASDTVGYDDPRRDGCVYILYDTYNGYYNSEGTRGRTLAKALETVCNGYQNISLVDPASIDGALAFQWEGWQVSFIDRDGSTVRGDNMLYPSMYFVWEKLTGDDHTGTEPQPEPGAVYDLLCMRRDNVGYGRSAASYKYPGLKDQLFEFISAHDGWELAG